MEEFVVDWVQSLIAFGYTFEGRATLSGTVTSATVGTGLHFWQRHQARSLPTLPSHHEALEGGDNVGTHFLAAVHDLTMTVTEAWNTARLRRKRLEEVIRRGRLKELAIRVNETGIALLERLDPYDQSAQLLDTALERTHALWSYDSRENYRTETYTVTTRDSEGRSRTETRTRQVYENTDHWFRFERSLLPGAEQATHDWMDDGTLRTFPRLDLHQRRVELDNLDPAQRSFLQRLVQSTVTRSDEEVPEEELERLANQWLLGSTLGDCLQAFRSGLSGAVEDAERCFRATEGAEPVYHYVTRSRSHDGPQEYRAVQTLLGHLGGSAGAWQTVLGAVVKASETGTQLVAWAEDPSVVEGDLEYGRLAVSVYEVCFPNSTLEVDRLPSGWLTSLASLGTGLAVAIGVYVYLNA